MAPDAQDGSEPTGIIFRAQSAYLFGLPYLDEPAQRLAEEGRVDEAIAVYADDIARQRATVDAAVRAGAVLEKGPGERAFHQRIAYDLCRQAEIEVTRPRVRQALNLTAMALGIIRRIEQEAPEEYEGELLVTTLGKFAQIRALCRVRLAEARAAIDEALPILRGLSDDSAEWHASMKRFTDLEADIIRLLDNRTDIASLGLPGTLLRMDSWRDAFTNEYRMARLAELEPAEMIEEAGSVDLAEAICWCLYEAGDVHGTCKLGTVLLAQGEPAIAEAMWHRADEGGDAEAAHRLGRLRQQRGDLTDAEACYRRAVERGSAPAVLDLAELLRRRGDLDGARTHYQAAEHQDAETAAKAQKALRKLDRTSPWSRLRGTSRHRDEP
ncbi:tetratricopeptide repeat protein [Catenulispora rubra]|uniref:tetratricopeptide repeat protein n=1 Tax=Catenulispora rubra TaxID=280293 RepID=UPI0018921DB7|nr:tetratricopeptide repeat protein [Catenulispora rubra]